MRRGGPPWWPEGEDWPPGGRTHWRARRAMFFRRAAGFFVVMVLVATTGVTLIHTLVAGLFGLFGVTTPGWTVFAVILLLGIFWIAIGGRAMRRVAAPVADLIEAAGRVQAGDLGVRVPERGPREVRDIARAFNAMASRLEAVEGQRRSLLADVTHELRTPLTVMQGSLEAMLDGVHPIDAGHIRPILDETHVLARLIDDLRTVSQAEAGVLRLERETCDLALLARAVVKTFAAQAEQAGVALAVETGDAPPVNADPVRTREVLANLLANALRYTPRGGRIAVEVSAAPEGVAVTVADTGSGIAADELPHVFDRFHRSADSRGMGLGLAIAKSLVVAHGGSIDAESAAGRGSRIRFILPSSGSS